MRFLLILLSALLALPAMAFETPAQQAVLIDATTGTTLFAKNATTQMGPSSMSKMMTVYIVLEKLKEGSLKLTDTLKVSEKAWRMGGSKMFVKLGDEVAVEDLLRGIAIQSGNDACITVAEGLAGSEDAFAEIMNVKARQLGLKDSHFANSTGWPDDNHYMTAEDLAKLAEAIIRDFPEYYSYWQEPEFTYNGIRQFNRNTLLGTLGVDGIKTGHTEAAGYGITTSAEQEGRRLISVVNGLDSKKGRIDASRELLTHGFRSFKIAPLFAKPTILVKEAKVWYGDKHDIRAGVVKPLILSLNEEWKDTAMVKVSYKEPLLAPVKAGDVIGTATLALPYNTPIELPLIALEDASRKSGFSAIWQTLKYRLAGEM